MQGQLCVLAENCDQPDYKKLVEALCSEHNVSLLSVPDSKQLGQWAGVRLSSLKCKKCCRVVSVIIFSISHSREIIIILIAGAQQGKRKELALKTGTQPYSGMSKADKVCRPGCEWEDYGTHGGLQECPGSLTSYKDAAVVPQASRAPHTSLQEQCAGSMLQNCRC